MIHERFVKGGVKISYRLFTMYVGQLRREDTENGLQTLHELTADEGFANFRSSPVNSNDEKSIALVRVPKRRYEAGGLPSLKWRRTGCSKRNQDVE